jgi:hypothetical protein
MVRRRVGEGFQSSQDQAILDLCRRKPTAGYQCDGQSVAGCLQVRTFAVKLILRALQGQPVSTDMPEEAQVVSKTRCLRLRLPMRRAGSQRGIDPIDPVSKILCEEG